MATVHGRINLNNLEQPESHDTEDSPEAALVVVAETLFSFRREEPTIVEEEDEDGSDCGSGGDSDSDASDRRVKRRRLSWLRSMFGWWMSVSCVQSAHEDVQKVDPKVISFLFC